MIISGQQPSAGEQHPKRPTPPTAAASPEFGLPTMQPPPARIRSPEEALRKKTQLRPAFASRS